MLGLTSWRLGVHRLEAVGWTPHHKVIDRLGSYRRDKAMRAVDVNGAEVRVHLLQPRPSVRTDAYRSECVALHLASRHTVQDISAESHLRCRRPKRLPLKLDVASF